MMEQVEAQILRDKVKPQVDPGPKRQHMTKDTILQELKTIFPDTNQAYLESAAQEMQGKPFRVLGDFIEALTKRDGKVPQEFEKEERRKFYQGPPPKLEDLELLYDNPEEHFLKMSKKESDLYRKNATRELLNEFRYTKSVTIRRIFKQNNCRYLPSRRALKEMKKERGSRRKNVDCKLPEDFDPVFLQEHAVRKVEDQFKEHLERQKKDYEKKVEEGRKSNTLQECESCFFEMKLPEEMMSCPSGHQHCKNCIKHGALQALSDQSTELPCFAKDVCKENFTLPVLEQALPPRMFARWTLNLQGYELEMADIPDLEKCPACPYACVMEESVEVNKIFACLNPSCKLKTCRICKTEAHIPLKCEEVERDGSMRKRHKIEEAMAEALIRRCPKCRTALIRFDGCNKMTCGKCKTSMCYLCKKTIRGYDHFEGRGTGNCPLWTSNEVLHKQDVAQAAQRAKAEADEEMPEFTLKFDPTKGYEKK